MERAVTFELRQPILVGREPGQESAPVVARELRGRDVRDEPRVVLAADGTQSLLYRYAAHALRVLAHGQHQRLGLGEHSLCDLHAEVAAEDNGATGVLGGLNPLQRAE